MSAAAPSPIATAREQTVRIARLNDHARSAMGGAAQGSGDPKDRWKGCGGVACTAVATVGFRSLPEADQSQVRELIETFDAFTEDNDPHGERDFGCIYQLGDGRWTTERPRMPYEERERVFWKLDYYDRELMFGSEDAANPAVTRRVLTIMLADEY